MELNERDLIIQNSIVIQACNILGNTDKYKVEWQTNIKIS